MKKKCFIKLSNVSLELPNYNNQKTLKNSIINFLKNNKVDSHELIINNINLSINSGDKIGVIGVNGAGKTTLLQIFGGIYKPTSGNIKSNGEKQLLLKIDVGLDLNLTGSENIELFLLKSNIKKKNMNSIRRYITDFTELGKNLDKPVSIYSSGMKQRLNFSLNTCLESSILIMDEFFSTGDTYFREKSINRVKKLIDKSSIFIFASHNLNILQNICNKIIWISEGKIVLTGKSDKVINLYKKRILKR